MEQVFINTKAFIKEYQSLCKQHPNSPEERTALIKQIYEEKCTEQDSSNTQKGGDLI